VKRTPAPRKALDGIEPYSEDASAPLNLSNNTPPFDPNPAWAEALASFPPEKVAAYPSLDSERLREAAARAHGVRPAQVVTGNGSNDLIDLAIRAFCEPGEVVAWHPPSFEMIAAFARVAGAQVKAVPLTQPGFQLDAAAMVEARAKVAFLCRPNNPTGNAFARADVERVVRDSEGLVVVDEAYADFHGDSLAGMVRDAPNLLVLRTLSKSHALASLRIGYGIAQEPIVRALGKARGPFRLNALSEHVALRALERTDYVRKLVDETRRERERIETALRTRGFKVNASDANFVFFQAPVEADALHKALLARGIAVRVFKAPELRGWLRATVGPAWVTQRFLRDLDDALREVGPRR
jgi:histidinol-phosphate aminotransferase